MSYKKMELDSLQKLSSLVQQQMHTTCTYMAAMDILQALPVSTNCETFQELVESTSSLLTLTNTVVMEEIMQVYNKQPTNTSSFLNDFMNMSANVAHTLNIGELDRDFETELEQDEEDDNDI